MAPLHLLGQDNQNEMQHDIFGHMMPLALALASSDTYSVTKGIIVFPGQDDRNEVKHHFLIM